MRSLRRQRFGATIGLLLLEALALNACGRSTATAPPAKPTPLAAATAPAAPTAAPAPASDALFALNWLHGIVTRYSVRRSARV